MKMKEYKAPKMKTVDFECKTSLLCGSCTTTDRVYRGGSLSSILDDVTDPKA